MSVIGPMRLVISAPGVTGEPAVPTRVTAADVDVHGVVQHDQLLAGDLVFSYE
jgi:hypothetical protein